MSTSRILDEHGRPIERNGHAPRDLFTMRPDTRRREIKASYDAARTTTEFSDYWANADTLDADSANSPTVRATMVKRARYEAGSNGYFDGIIQTHANYIVGVGPSLRMGTLSKGFNELVEARFAEWWKAVNYRRQLWCMFNAKPQDGEAFAVHKDNPAAPLSLGMVTFETEQCASPYLPFNARGRIDGVWFDDFGNVTHYDILKYHPGGAWSFMDDEPDKVPAAFVLHLFALRRAGQHRAVPEFRSTLNVGAGSRRWREATIAAAETAADFAAVIKTTMSPDNVDLATPFSEAPVNKRMITALPAGYDMSQFDGKHPNATFETFHRAQINEQARPKSMPLNIALSDSSQSNFASGKLDRGPYHLQCDIERKDAEELCLDKSFALWWERACLEFGWNMDPKRPPKHAWDWPRYPIGDAKAEEAARDTRLKNGTLSLSDAYAEQGEDFEDKVIGMARDYGVSVDEMRKILLKTNLGSGVAAEQPEPEDDPPEEADAGLAVAGEIRADTVASVKEIHGRLDRLGDLILSSRAAAPVSQTQPQITIQNMDHSQFTEIAKSLGSEVKAGVVDGLAATVSAFMGQQPQYVINMPEQPAPTVNVVNQVPELPPPTVVNNFAPSFTQEPAQVKVDVSLATESKTVSYEYNADGSIKTATISPTKFPG